MPGLHSRGLGYQMPLMVFCLIAFWGCGVSLGAILTFRVGLGLPGLWFGITGGTFTAGELGTCHHCIGINCSRQCLSQ